MAELLLNEENRQRLAEMIHGLNCPQNLDPHTFTELRSGRRTALSMRGLDAIAQASGRAIYKELTNKSSHS
jgi:hypothetical protein